MTEPGWYPDPEMAGTQRYWDGTSWTGHRAPLAKSDETSDVLVWIFVIVVALIGLPLVLVLVL